MADIRKDAHADDRHEVEDQVATIAAYKADANVQTFVAALKRASLLSDGAEDRFVLLLSEYEASLTPPASPVAGGAESETGEVNQMAGKPTETEEIPPVGTDPKSAV